MVRKGGLCGAVVPGRDTLPLVPRRESLLVVSGRKTSASKVLRKSVPELVSVLRLEGRGVVLFVDPGVTAIENNFNRPIILGCNINFHYKVFHSIYEPYTTVLLTFQSFFWMVSNCTV